MEPNDFASAMAQYTPEAAQATLPQNNQPAGPTAPAAPAHKGNFLTHLLPTAGGILGGILGIPGDIFGGAGSIIGAGGGAAAGKALENKLEGNGMGSGVLTNAIEGGVGQGIGGLLGKLGGGVLRAAGSKSEGLANNLLKGQFSKGAIGGDSAAALRAMGISDARQIPQISNIVTGTDGALNQGVERTLMNSGQPIEVADLIGSKNNPIGMANDLISGNTAIGDSAGKKILFTTDKATQNMLGGANGMVGKQMADPLDVLKESRNFAKLAAQARDIGYRTGNAEQSAVADVYQQLSDELNTRIFRPAGAQVPLTDEVKSHIIDNLSPLKDINPTVHTNMVNSVANAKTLEDLRGLQAPFVQGSKAVTATERAADRGAGATAAGAMNPLTGAVAGGPHGMLGAMAGMLVRHPAMDRAAIPVVSRGGGILGDIGESGALPKLGGAGGVLTTTANNLIQPGGNGTVDNMNDITGAPVNATAPNPMTRDDLLTLALYAPGSLAALAPSPQQQQNVVNATAAESALHNLGNAPGGGILSSIAGKFGVGSTGEYQRKAASAAEQISAALPGTDPDAIRRQLTDYMAGGANIDEAVKSLLTRLDSVVKANQSTGLQGILGFNGGAPAGGVLGAANPVAAY